MDIQETASLVQGQCLNTHPPPPLQLLPSFCGVGRCQEDVIHNPGRSHISGGKPDFCLPNMEQMTFPTRHQLALCAQLWWGVQGLDGAENELCCPSPDVQPLPVALASSRSGAGMLVPGAVCSTPSAQEQMPAVCRAVSHAAFTSTEIQIRRYQGELHASIACLIKSFTLCS